jgi:hypothetical protein
MRFVGLDASPDIRGLIRKLPNWVIELIRCNAHDAQEISPGDPGPLELFWGFVEEAKICCPIISLKILYASHVECFLPI